MCTENQTPHAVPSKPQAREIIDHKVNGLNDAIRIEAIDLPGPGGANHRYRLSLFGEDNHSLDRDLVVDFQNGGVQEVGPNGYSIEAFITLAIDRLRGFQHGRKEDGTFDYNSRGKFACRENAVALTHLEEGLMWLQRRTHERVRRGVEGKVVA